MKHLVLVGTLVGALGAGAAYGQTAEKQADTKKAAKPASKKMSGDSMTTTGAGHAAPKPQPNVAPAPPAPTGDMPLGVVRIPKPVKADGKPLSPGVYQVRLTAQAAAGDDKGATKALERWVEFLQNGQVKGREVVTIVPQTETDKVEKDTPPRPNSAKVEMLKGGDYYRVWINKGGNQYLIHLPPAA